MSLKVGERVEVVGKDCQGEIAYIGHLSFASGKWIGVILDEPKGKNNGTVKGQSYFKCAENHGMFVRQSQLVLIDESGNRIEPVSPSSSYGGSSTSTIAADDVGAARARSRLSSSRLSLAGSRTQLAAPSSENLATHERKDDVAISQIPQPTVVKRSSFVEKTLSTSSSPGKRPKAQDDHNNTGFVETLKPKFVPGQAMAGSMLASNVMEEKLSQLQLSQENDNLKAQVNDLTEKVETLRVKRMQDKEKMKDYEKTKLQLEHLLEFKSKVMESQASLQRELQRAKQDVQEAISAKEQFQEEMSELAETMEMATLDKEMAEEKSETLQIELEQLKEKLEEQTLDLEILRTEMSERRGDRTSASPSTYEIKQLEQQNSRLRETLVKMRDLSAHEKHEFQKLLKDLDQKKSEILELRRTKEKLSTRVEEMEHQIADLQEQVDAALGAEEMVVALGEKKMALEEKVAELEEAVSDLEALQDMSDQLAESSKELELELREELDLALASVRDSHRHRDAAMETLADREMTIAKFRELTHQLQEQCMQLQQRVQSTESTKFGSKGTDQQLADILDFQKTFAETRAQTKAVDLELRRLEIEEARSHVKYLISFMPPVFMARGGDHEAILTLLLVPRMIQKTEILVSQVQDKYRPIEKIDRTTVTKGHSVAQYAFSSRLRSHMYALQTALGCFDSALNLCSAESLLKIGAAYPEMVAQEKSLDSLIELAKRDQLDENLPMEAIEKCCSYFTTMYSIHFGENELFANQSKLVVNGTRTLGSACEAIATEAFAIKTLINGDPGEIGVLCHHVETACEVIQQHLKSARRRVPRDQVTSRIGLNLGLAKDWIEQLSTSYQHATKVSKTLQDLLKSALQAIVADGDLECGMTAIKLKDMAAISSEKIYDTDDMGPLPTIKASLTLIQQLAASLAQKMTECENELTISGDTQRQSQSEATEAQSPIAVRAQIARKESEETKILSRKLEGRESDIREARLALREKQEELSEMTLRKDLVDKRLATQQHEHEMNLEKIKRKLEEAENKLKRKEKEFEETMDHLQTDIDSLESEKGQLKEKLKTITKKPLSSSISGVESIVGSESNVSLTSASSPTSDNRLLYQQNALLREALCCEQQQSRKLLFNDLQKKLDNLAPLDVGMIKSSDSKLAELNKKRNELLKELRGSMVYPIVPDVSRGKASSEHEIRTFDKVMEAHKYLQRRTALMELQDRAARLANEIREETIKRTTGGAASSNFAVFPSKELAAAIRQKPRTIAAQVEIPCKGKSGTFSVDVGTKELRTIHQILTY